MEVKALILGLLLHCQFFLISSVTPISPSLGVPTTLYTRLTSRVTLSYALFILTTDGVSTGAKLLPHGRVLTMISTGIIYDVVNLSRLSQHMHGGEPM